jgi:hypothetical protein
LDSLATKGLAAYLIASFFLAASEIGLNPPRFRSRALHLAGIVADGPLDDSL